jgi:hypothetical protein
MLKKVDKEKNPGLAKLPEKVRNRMGYAKKGKIMKANSGKLAMIKQLRGKQVGPAEEERLMKMPIQELREKVREKKMTKAKTGKMIKANVGMAAKKVRENQMMKASMGKSVRGFGAARTSGMGLQDEQLPPGKSLDYYKDLM